MNIEKLAENGNVSTKQVLRRWREIGGVTKKGGDLYIPDGTRYPIRKPQKIDTHEEKMYVLLKAIDNERYINEDMLNTSKDSFDTMLRELLDLKWIRYNGSSNEFGANKYDSTLLGSRIAREKRSAALKEIINSISGALGHFVGGVISELVM